MLFDRPNWAKVQIIGKEKRSNPNLEDLLPPTGAMSLISNSAAAPRFSSLPKEVSPSTSWEHNPAAQSTEWPE